MKSSTGDLQIKNNKINLTKVSFLFDLCEKYRDTDIEKQKALSDYCNIIASDSYVPILTDSLLDCLLQWIKVIDTEIADIFEYYFYEAKNMKDWWLIVIDWIDYHIRNKKDVLYYLKSNYDY